MLTHSQFSVPSSQVTILSRLFFFSIKLCTQIKLLLHFLIFGFFFYYFSAALEETKEGAMEKSQNFGHEHPLVLMNEEQINNQSKEAECWMCGEKVSAPCFSCLECHGFYLHKICAEAPSEINHPFHGDHPLVLQHNPPDHYGRCYCNFCYETCKRFIYHCSCRLDFHIKCALLTYNMAEKNLKEFEHVVLEDPFISTENDGKELEDLSECFVCWEPLTNYTYFSPDCGFNLHKKCVELPFKINLKCHRKHPLILHFNSDHPCQICQESKYKQIAYCC